MSLYDSFQKALRERHLANLELISMDVIYQWVREDKLSCTDFKKFLELRQSAKDMNAHVTKENLRITLNNMSELLDKPGRKHELPMHLLHATRLTYQL